MGFLKKSNVGISLAVLVVALAAVHVAHPTNLVSATIRGVLQNLTAQPVHVAPDLLKPVKSTGKPFLFSRHVLVTGANRGLGKGIAIQCAALGLHVIMACRKMANCEHAARDVIAAASKMRVKAGGDFTGAAPLADAVTVVQLDLARLSSVERCADTLKKRDVSLHYIVTNAAIVPPSSSLTLDGLETAFQVNYLGHFHLINLLRTNGVFPIQEHPQSGGGGPGDNPHLVRRLVVVTSESHRIAQSLAKLVETLGQPVQYGMSGALTVYGNTKLLLVQWAHALASRWNAEGTDNQGKLRIAVSSICPGPVASDIARHAPKWAQWLFEPFKLLFFRDPLIAAAPVVQLLVDELPLEHSDTGDAAGSSSTPPLSSFYNTRFRYVHIRAYKRPRADAFNRTLQVAAWEQSQALISDIQNKQHPTK